MWTCVQAQQSSLEKLPIFHALPSFSCTRILRISGRGTLTPKHWQSCYWEGSSEIGLYHAKWSAEAKLIQIGNLEIGMFKLEILKLEMFELEMIEWEMFNLNGSCGPPYVSISCKVGHRSGNQKVSFNNGLSCDILLPLGPSIWSWCTRPFFSHAYI